MQASSAQTYWPFAFVYLVAAKRSEPLAILQLAQQLIQLGDIAMLH